MKLIFHGGAMEVGKLCIEMQTESSNFLLDCGLKLGLETEYPELPKKMKDIDAVIVSHAHLDHTGSLAYFRSKGLTCPAYMTLPTKDLTKILLKDNFKVESLTKIPPYEQKFVNAVFEQFRVKEYGRMFQIKDTYFGFFDAGHIPGSAVTLIESEEKRIVFTGDINLAETRLLEGADIKELHDVDTLITETTYGDRDHPDKEQEEKRFLDKVKETVARKGQVFIPVFAVGRAQEILLLLNTMKWNVPIYIDGMAEQVTEFIIAEHSCKDVNKLREARNKVIAVHGSIDREKALKTKGIFITTSGMLAGGPILDYIKSAYKEPKNSILLTGYVSEGTNGRLLMDEGSIFIDGFKVNVKAEYLQFDFSAHSGLAQLNEMVDRIRPKRIILVHGDAIVMQKFADHQRKLGREVFVPKIGSELNI